MTSLLSEGLATPTKVCDECGQEKPLDSYNKHAKAPDGRQRRCRECFSAYNARRYASDRERFKSAVKVYKETHPDAVFATRYSIWVDNPSRLNLYRLMEAALAAKVIARASECRLCALPDSEAGGHGLHMHHFDYADPLNVIWVCPKCHSAIHKLKRDRERAAK